MEYEIIKSAEDDFEVWTPDECGACIASGKTEAEARAKAIQNMERCIVALRSNSELGSNDQAEPQPPITKDKR